ncbi:GNAT family N-acetyltransferase [uncultured Erythrobacter sp.]|uniref:GNAT family N-acetyltransferase n=1 Tax=uncultured Erythrobacter sp. TaxID=263913 RepID=UPI002629E569|nr:GNAT family N-acetyltransferase [uncultured Erythrobacter sp.]
MIETAHLELRPPIYSDFEASAAMFAEQRVVLHLGGVPLTRAKAWEKFLRDVGHWVIEDFGLFSIIEKASEEYVGKIGFARFERDLSSQTDTFIEMSWTLRSCFHGRGYAFEAAIASQAWFDEKFAGRTACVISPDNKASIKLAKRIGYLDTGNTQLDNSSVNLLTRDVR